MFMTFPVDKSRAYGPGPASEHRRGNQMGIVAELTEQEEGGDDRRGSAQTHNSTQKFLTWPIGHCVCVCVSGFVSFVP